MPTPCLTPDCPNDARDDVDSGLCWACTAQKKRTGKAVGATPRHASAWNRLTEAAIEYANADDALDYEDPKKAKLDFARARDQLRKAGKAYGPTDHGERTREGMERARAAGVMIHRPPKVTPTEANAAVKAHGSAKRASAALGVSLRTLRRQLKVFRERINALTGRRGWDNVRGVTEGTLMSPPELRR